ncbi:MAG: MBL fold metallo-hydrolase [Planctomycetes bacterium]|nr:MBL fold metallo-hydrolase [Planctomycetota bacterium]
MTEGRAGEAGADAGRPIVEGVVVSPFRANAYLLGCPWAREAAWIDPGDEADRLLEILRRSDLRLTSILLTHGHIDHVAAAGALREATGATIAIHAADLDLYRRAREQGILFGCEVDPPPEPDRLLADGDEVRAGELCGRVLHTPGHSPGSVSFEFPGANLVFTGDTIMCEGVGRTDLWDGSWPALVASIRTRIFSLPEERILLSGHGPRTTVGWEKSHNPFVRPEP